MTETVYVSPGGKVHLTKFCAGTSWSRMSLREAAGEHDPCGTCFTDDDVDRLEAMIA